MLARSSGRLFLVALTATAALGALAGCTKSSPTVVVTTNETVTHTGSPSLGPTDPVSTGKIVETRVSACPYLSITTAKGYAGMRLERITKLTQDGKTVGCRFYPAVFTTENLPPTSQLAIEILATKFASPVAANNALVHTVEQGTNPQTDKLTSSITAGCYQTVVWAKDPKGKDWACGFSKGVTMVVIRTVVNDPALNVVEIAKAIVGKF